MFISVWASALLVQLDKAMRQPLCVGRAKSSLPHFLFCIDSSFYAIFTLLNKLLEICRMSGSNRILWADALKAFAIIFVMLGHVLPFVMGDKANPMTIHYIGVLQMPLFMAISGYCSYKAFVEWLVVKKRFLQLVVPFICWPLVWYLIKMDFTGITDYYLALFIFPDRGLWFLFVLFLITLIEYFRNKVVRISLKNHDNSDIAFYFSLLVTECLLLTVFYAYKRCGVPGNWINFVALYYPYYSLGCIMRLNNNWLLSNLRWLGPLGLLVYSIATYFLDSYLWQIPLASGGILGMFFIFQRFFDRPLPRIIMFTGTSTLGIYAVHQPVIQYIKHLLIKAPLWADVVITFVLTYIISILAVWVFKKNRITAFLFLGIPFRR